MSDSHREQHSNYLGNGKRYDGANGTDVAVSRGPAGEWMYDFEPMRREAERLGTAVRFWCPLNKIAVAGFTGPEPVADVELGAGGYLTRPARIWCSSSTHVGETPTTCPAI